MIRLGITGTDTGVGKTLVACALAAGLTRRGLRITAMKPIETGVTANDPLRDGARLARAAQEMRPLSVIAPLTLPDPLAPLAAARRAGLAIDLAALDLAVHSAADGCDALIVEGAGGLLVPITDTVSFDSLFVRWSLDVIIVAANRLGTINHIRLTCAAARRVGLTIRAIVLSSTSAEAPDGSVEDNAQLIAELEQVRVIELPHVSRPDELDAIVAIAEERGLIELFVAERARHTTLV